MENKELIFFKNLKSTYDNNVDLDRLIILAVDKLVKNNIEATFDNVVVTAFKLFPKRFSLTAFPEYPDGKRVHDCLWHCTYKTKMWLVGNAKSGYSLTNKGKYILEEAKKEITGQIKSDKKYVAEPVKRKEWYFITSIKNSSAFKKFLDNKKTEITDDEMLRTLMATNRTSHETLTKNFELLTKYAEKLNEKRVIDFLQFLKEKILEGS
jgi:hypothetical protein